jgi:hypothetical protein
VAFPCTSPYSFTYLPSTYSVPTLLLSHQPCHHFRLQEFLTHRPESPFKLPISPCTTLDAPHHRHRLPPGHSADLGSPLLPASPSTNHMIYTHAFLCLIFGRCARRFFSADPHPGEPPQRTSPAQQPKHRRKRQTLSRFCSGRRVVIVRYTRLRILRMTTTNSLTSSWR